MSRRPMNPARRYEDSGGGGSIYSAPKSRSSPYLPVTIIIVGVLLLMGYLYSDSGDFGSIKKPVRRVEGDFSCAVDVQQAIPLLKKAYGDSMNKVLHVGPDTCSVVSRLLKEKETEAWGVEPYDIEDADNYCKGLVQKGIVRVADIKFSLPYRPKSFSVVIVSDALDYLSPRYLNKTIPDLARVSSDALVIFAGSPGQRRAKIGEMSRFGRMAKFRSSSWWIRYFVQKNLDENEVAIKKFEHAARKRSYKPHCQIFHLKSSADILYRFS
ncbi:S-adenosyl-L-methionine-dependent methyltransferase [Melia azedarach]|uniref:S-adenosyl-L-methionine-dependent methyltransferase n=1 Tax=Melia azedarach TaxID=155640 RepID=A0ACC1WRP9_MELAZ|nr:S-adenosyl-L-methionine-dependent methyltransferase [Melia azedarach]